ncbi:rho GTPase-activating protein 4-like isoform X2 [Leptidea sinapis]|uniref:rho GTPase-activating protein 4-like isoform X2 n=1 Tax=Leptidea sinapis TaxID=189913 RepID=UPI00212BC8E4|nr:rho GTPase-activating protein 4-like isoform X2 [Leptidea sinapis]XP_050663604.1 rho GTPase-activating protein 4-like isoform X2 [Leptidea sinapis]
MSGSGSGATTPCAVEAPSAPATAPVLASLDERDLEPRTPMKRLGSTRKLAAFNNIRLQLSEQSRVLEARAEAAAGVAGELHELCRRRADLEHEYSRALDKLARVAQQRHKDHRHKREQWPLIGAYECWQAALENTRALSRDHAALAELYGGTLAARLQRAADDVLRLHRKCRDVVCERQEEIGAALCEAAAGGKAHAAAAAEWRAAALKLRLARTARAQRTDPASAKKLKALDKELDKRRARHSEARAKALRARAEYVLSLEAANATLQRYYLDDIADVMRCTEVGYEAVVSRAVRSAAAADAARAQSLRSAGAALVATADRLDALGDRQRTREAHAAAFTPPRPLAPRADREPRADDADDDAEAADEPEDEGVAAVRHEVSARLRQLEAAAAALRAEVRERAKTLDAAEAELVRQVAGPAALWDAAGLLESAAPHPPHDDDAPRRDQEDYYLEKFRSYVTCAGRLARLEGRAAGARERLAALGGAGPGAAGDGLFTAPVDDELPVPLTSCVRVIATYGLRQQGIFRVSGSQVEMMALRAAFARGEDPLRDVRDATDLNSVCGLLKLYLREMRPPLLEGAARERLLRLAAEGSAEGAAGADEGQFVSRARSALLPALAPPALLTLRYLFAFLAHLAAHASHNMMDAWNLAICLGPTLLPAGGHGGAQVTAQNLVNELLKRLIVHHHAVFPQDVAPHTLFVPPATEDSEVDGGAETVDGGEGRGYAQLSDDENSETETEPSEEDGDPAEQGGGEQHRCSATQPRAQVAS